MTPPTQVPRTSGPQAESVDLRIGTSSRRSAFPHRWDVLSSAVSRRAGRAWRPVTAALLALSVVAGGAAVAPSPVSAWSTEQVLEAQLLQQLNNERAARGVKPLVSDAGLEHASQVWSNHMSS